MSDGNKVHPVEPSDQTMNPIIQPNDGQPIIQTSDGQLMVQGTGPNDGQLIIQTVGPGPSYGQPMVQTTGGQPLYQPMYGHQMVQQNMGQPIAQTNVGQQGVQPQNAVKRDFSTGLCGCFEDFGGCIFALCCYPCHLCSLATKMNECCCVPCLPGGLMAMRTKVRTKYGIRGSILDDCCVMTCCNGLATCQMERELKNVGI